MRAISFGINYWSKVCELQIVFEGNSNTKVQIAFLISKKILLQFKPNNQQAYFKTENGQMIAHFEGSHQFTGFFV